MPTLNASPSRPWPWTPAQIEAAHRLADDVESDEVIARRLSISRATLWRWKRRPEFAERVRALRAEFEQAFSTAIRKAVIARYEEMAARAGEQRAARRRR